MPEPVFDQSCDNRVSVSRAVVPLSAPAKPSATPASPFRPDARFVVHLIATAAQIPQTRALRRVEARDGALAYARSSATMRRTA